MATRSAARRNVGHKNVPVRNGSGEKEGAQAVPSGWLLGPVYRVDVHRALLSFIPVHFTASKYGSSRASSGQQRKRPGYGESDGGEDPAVNLVCTQIQIKSPLYDDTFKYHP